MERSQEGVNGRERVRAQMWGECPAPPPPRQRGSKQVVLRGTAAAPAAPGRLESPTMWGSECSPEGRTDRGTHGATVRPDAFLALIHPVRCFLGASGVNQVKSKLELSPTCPYFPFLNPVQVPTAGIRQFM